MKKRAAPLFLAVLTACALACPGAGRRGASPEATPSVLYPSRGFGVHEGDRPSQDQQDLRTLSYG